jgi:adenylate cyclase
MGDRAVADAIAPQSRKLGLKTVLTGLVLATVVLTALFIHLLWSNAARNNVADVVGQLNAEIVGTIRNEVLDVRRDAIAVQNALREAFFQGIIDPKDEAKREFIAQALLRSQSVLSWVSFGFPDGGFFGAQKLSDQELNMVEVRWEEGSPSGQLRIDNYVLNPEGKVANFEFTRRLPLAASSYKATEQPWYRRAIAEGDSGWSEVMTFPTGGRAAIGTSVPVYFANVAEANFRGVANVVIELEQLSRFLQGLRVGKRGTTVIIDRAGHVVASPDDRAIEQQKSGEMPTLQQLGADGNRMLALVDHTLRSMQVSLPDLDRTEQIEIVDPTDGESYYVTFAPLRFQGWTVATVIPVDVFLASIEENVSDLLIALALLTLAMAGLAVVLANTLVARPLTRIVGQLKHIGSFRLDQVTYLPSRLREFDGLSTALLQMSRGLASFQKYMPTELVRTLVSRGIEAKPGGSQENLTVLFADLAGFTSLSETLGEGVVPVLTEYLETASSAVVSHKGTIDKFIGDAVMAFWGAPIENAAHARDACAAGLGLQRMMSAQQAQLAAGDPRAGLRVRVGINTGRMLVGNVGSAERLNYTVIGDPVNVASRLEALNKRYGTTILIGEETRRAAGAAIVVRQLDWVAVYGRSEGMAIYELLAMAEDADSNDRGWVASYEAGLGAYAERRWSEAERSFAAADAARDGGDPPSRLMIERCRDFVRSPPGPEWTSVAVQMEK